MLAAIKNKNTSGTSVLVACKSGTVTVFCEEDEARWFISPCMLLSLFLVFFREEEIHGKVHMVFMFLALGIEATIIFTCFFKRFSFFFKETK